MAKTFYQILLQTWAQMQPFVAECCLVHLHCLVSCTEYYKMLGLAPSTSSIHIVGLLDSAMLIGVH